MSAFLIVMFCVHIFCGSAWATEQNALHCLVMGNEYKDEQTKIIKAKKLIQSGVDVNALCYITGASSWGHFNNESSTYRFKTTALGLATCRYKYSCQSLLAEELVSLGARLTGSYENRFGFYFSRKMINVPSESYDNGTPYCKLLETLLYRRVQYCCKKSMALYCIAHRIKNKSLYPALSSSIPKSIVDLIASFIIKDGIDDVITVLSETTEDEHKASKHKETSQQGVSLDQKKHRTYYTIFEIVDIWEKSNNESVYISDIRPFNAQEWEKDFNEFVQYKRNNEWREPKKDQNLILRSIRYTRDPRNENKGSKI